MKIALIAPANLPIPTVRGGAIETLLNNFIDVNENQKSLEITVFSEYHKDAYQLSTGYQYTKFVYLRRGAVYRLLNFPFRVVRKITAYRTSYLDIVLTAWHIKRLKVDKIIIEGSSYQLVELKKFFKKEKLIFHMHADIITTKSYENIRIVNSASMIIVASEFLRRQILQNSDGHCSPIKILRNGLKLEYFAKSISESNNGIIRKFNIPEGIPVVLYVGRIVELKGIMQLYLALKNIREKLPIHFLIVGSFGSGFGFEEVDDEFSLKLKKYFNENKAWITLTGFIHNSELPAIYNISDLMVVPSICEDASPLVILEALATGTPLIITDAGGMSEYITNECAFIIKRDENIIDNLSLTILSLLQDRKKLQLMSQAALSNSLNYSIENYYKGFVNILTNSF